MSALRRLFVVMLAYLSAAAFCAGAFLAYGFISSDGSGWDFSEAVFGFAVFVAIALIYPLPVAIPVILLTELRRVSHWPVFVISGLVLSVLLTFAFTEVPYQGLNIFIAVTMTTLSLSGAMIYWLVAWKLLPRGKSAIHAAERTQ
ncbi:MAG: hypothetical protein ACKOQ3_08885 [Novosphingobium sp.]